MNRETNNDRLLEDVLAGAATAEFRATLLATTVQLVRRRRRVRRARRIAISAAAMVALMTALLSVFTPRASKPRAMEAPCAMVRTQPLPATAIVGTQSLSLEQQVASAPFVTVVHTTPGSGGFRFISDEELLALVAPRPVVLVRVGPHAQELIFVNPTDRQGFPVN